METINPTGSSRAASLSLANRITESENKVVAGKQSIRNALLSKEIPIPENPTFQKLADGVNSIIPGAELTLNNYPLKPNQVILPKIYQNDDMKYGELLQREDGVIVYISGNDLYRFDQETYTSSLLGNFSISSRQYCSSKYSDKILFIGDKNLVVLDTHTLTITTYDVVFPVFDYDQSRQNAIIAYDDNDNRMYYGSPGFGYQYYNLYFGFYDINSSTLTALPNSPKYFFKSGFNHKIINNKLYTFRSSLDNHVSNSPGTNNDPYSYDTVTSAWTRLADFPEFFIYQKTNPTFIQQGYSSIIRHQYFKGFEDYIYIIFNSSPMGTAANRCDFVVRYSISKNLFDLFYPNYTYFLNNKQAALNGNYMYTMLVSLNKVRVKMLSERNKEVIYYYDNINNLPINSKLASYNLNVRCSDENNEYPANTDFSPIGNIIKIMDDVSSVSGTIKIPSQEI